jgi:hypothetical protein
VVRVYYIPTYHRPPNRTICGNDNSSDLDIYLKQRLDHYLKVNFYLRFIASLSPIRIPGAVYLIMQNIMNTSTFLLELSGAT